MEKYFKLKQHSCYFVYDAAVYGQNESIYFERGARINHAVLISLWAKSFWAVIHQMLYFWGFLISSMAISVWD